MNYQMMEGIDISLPFLIFLLSISNWISFVIVFVTNIENCFFMKTTSTVIVSNSINLIFIATEVNATY